MTKRYAAFCAALLSFVVFLIAALWGATFGIDGSTSRTLLPGTTAPISVQLSNPHFYPIEVSELTVRIAGITTAHKGATCSAGSFTVNQGAKFSARIAPFSKIDLGSITPNTTQWPSVHLASADSKLDNGCQGATIHLAYSAHGTWWVK